MEEALDAYAAAGFRNVEFQLAPVKEWLAAGRDVTDWKRLLDERELRCIGGFEAGVLCFAEPAAMRANHELHIQNARLLHELGGGVMVVGTDGPEQPYLTALDVMAPTFGGLGARLAAAAPGVEIAIEFNWSPIVKSLATAAEIARRSQSANIGVLFDPAHYHCTPSKFEHLTPANIALIAHVHVDDMRDKPGELSNCNSDRVLPGEGILNLRSLFGQMEKHGYDGYFSIEMFSDELWALPANQAARKMYDSLLPLCDDA